MDLTETDLQDLCEAERMALQRVALEQLNMLSLGCHIQVPKGELVCACTSRNGSLQVLIVIYM